MITTYNYMDKKSLVLEKTSISAEFIPVPGGKLASLINKKTGHKHLLQLENEKYHDQQFDSVYIDGECCGYNDMFTTINVYTYINKPWKGVYGKPRNTMYLGLAVILIAVIVFSYCNIIG